MWIEYAELRAAGQKLVAFLGRSPDTASFEDIRRYQLHLAAGGAGVSTLKRPAPGLGEVLSLLWSCGWQPLVSIAAGLFSLMTC
jgi:hypothetical protein